MKLLEELGEGSLVGVEGGDWSLQGGKYEETVIKWCR